jgi:hypothetical protein
MIGDKTDKTDAQKAPAQSTTWTWKTVHSAVRWHKLDEAKRLIEMGGLEAAMSVDEGNGNQPIHIAAQNGHLDLVEYLVSKKVDANVKNGKGNTALHMAISYDYYDCGKALIAGGADVNLLNEQGFPGLQGIDGDKSIPLVAFVQASQYMDAEKAAEALKMCKEDLAAVNDKACFAQTGMKLKKGLKEKWTEEMQNDFKGIMLEI